MILVTQILQNVDLFNILDYHCRLANVETLKTLPDMDNKEIAVWKCIDLIVILCYLGDKYETTVRELLKFPIDHCPDILCFTLLEANVLWSQTQKDLVQELLPIFFGNHPNSGVILHKCWNHQFGNEEWRPVLIAAMTEWYMMAENDQTRLSRILDMAQDLKALFNLLNSHSFPFVIDLACLAYRREFLKLDKWLNDKIYKLGESFVAACVKFLQKRCPQLVGGKEDLLPKSCQLPTETVTTILTHLQPSGIMMSKELADTVNNLVRNWATLLNAQQQRSHMPTMVSLFFFYLLFIKIFCINFFFNLS